MKLITLNLPEYYIQALDNLVQKKMYPNRAEAIRIAIRDLLNIEVWSKKTIDSLEIMERTEDEEDLQGTSYERKE